MKIQELNQKPGITSNTNLNRVFNQFEKLLSELRKKEILVKIVQTINKNIEKLNAVSDSYKEFRKHIRKKQAII